MYECKHKVWTQGALLQEKPKTFCKMSSKMLATVKEGENPFQTKTSARMCTKNCLKFHKKKKKFKNHKKIDRNKCSLPATATFHALNGKNEQQQQKKKKKKKSQKEIFSFLLFLSSVSVSLKLINRFYYGLTTKRLLGINETMWILTPER